jgi:hypothetical protein
MTRRTSSRYVVFGKGGEDAVPLAFAGIFLAVCVGRWIRCLSHSRVRDPHTADSCGFLHHHSLVQWWKADGLGLGSVTSRQLHCFLAFVIGRCLAGARRAGPIFNIANLDSEV